ncbi:thiol reductant ABC exporter subunit CydD [uncultured Cohaesibacter sp.]|uniref:thiol reductant ABC exporter subunit CydD n=1 Tax=uncultured Cohaesibacter sp. TaxID=1002546 RepID=UPI002AA83B5C|nr:thiol reductant ABC exporter subunit CydD [uncultured Cohaesibacter sp.]
MSTKHITAFLKAQSRRARHPLNLSIVLSFAAGIVLIVQMGVIAFCVDSVLTKQATLTDLLFALPPLLILFFLRAILSYFSERLALKAAIDLKHTLRKDLLARLIAKGPILERGSENAVGDQVTTLTEGIEALEGYFARYMPAMVMTVLLPFAILAVTLTRDWVSAVVMVVTAPLIPVFMILIGKGTERLNQKQWRKLARLSAHFLDMIQGLTTLKLFNASRREAETVSRMAESYRRTTMSVLRVAFLSSLVLEFFATVSIAIIAVFIGFRLLYGNMTFFDGFYVLLLAPDFYLPLRNMGTHYHARMEAVGAAEAMVSVMELDDGSAKKDGALDTLPDLKQGISLEFRSVGFVYPDGTRALEDVSFTLDAGQSLALVGPSGAGKSTIIDLILGLAQPSEGQILVNGIDLSTLPIGAWRQQLAYVPQKPTLFSGTIMDAIRYGQPDAGMEAVEAAAKLAQAHDFITGLSDGYAHQLNEKGAGLSGGQIQRIAIARALLRDAPLVLLDEPSAHLDRENEARIQNALHALEQSATTITIAHRLHTIEQADAILVMQQGKIAEMGRHDALVEKDGAYAALVRSTFDGASKEVQNG